jgi:hypothetical protein
LRCGRTERAHITEAAHTSPPNPISHPGSGSGNKLCQFLTLHGKGRASCGETGAFAPSFQQIARIRSASQTPVPPQSPT